MKTQKRLRIWYSNSTLGRISLTEAQNEKNKKSIQPMMLGLPGLLWRNECAGEAKCSDYRQQNKNLFP